jgi:hypothetical protein
MRDPEDINSERRLLAAVRRSIRQHCGDRESHLATNCSTSAYHTAAGPARTRQSTRGASHTAPLRTPGRSTTCGRHDRARLVPYEHRARPEAMTMRTALRRPDHPSAIGAAHQLTRCTLKPIIRQTDRCGGCVAPVAFAALVVPFHGGRCLKNRGLSIPCVAPLRDDRASHPSFASSCDSRGVGG